MSKIKYLSTCALLNASRRKNRCRSETAFLKLTNLDVCFGYPAHGRNTGVEPHALLNNSFQVFHLLKVFFVGWPIGTFEYSRYLFVDFLLKRKYMNKYTHVSFNV